MFWDRDRLLMALTTKKLILSGKPQSHAGLLYKSYADFYGLNCLTENLSAEQSIQVVPSVDFDLVVQNFIPKKEINNAPQVLLLHGYFDHVGLYQHLIKHLLIKGIRVTAFDLPGHGLSSGKRAVVRSFSQYQQALKSVVANQLDKAAPLFVIGQSTGAAIVADTISSEEGSEIFAGFDLRKTVLMAPLLKPFGWGKAEFLHTLLDGRKTYWPRSYKDNSHDEDFLRFVRKEDPLQHHVLSVEWVGALRFWIRDMLKRVPNPSQKDIAIIQGTEDTTVDWKYNLKLYRKLFPKSTVSKIDGAGHHLVGESEAFRERIFAALDRALI